MRKAMNENMLKMTWEQLTGVYGKLTEAATDMEVVEHDNYRILFIPCTFEGGKLKLQLTFDRKGQICGMYFR
jgi:hypothetical protein